MPTSPAPAILIITSSSGQGHNATAESIASVLKAQAPQVPVRIVDTRSFLRPLRKWFYTRGYIIGSLLAPPVYRLGHNLVLRSPFILRRVKQGFRKEAARLQASLGDFHPTTIVAVSAHGAGVAAHLKGMSRVPVRFLFVYTDFQSHSLQRFPGVDRYYVPAESVAQELREAGIASAAITVSGVPVRQQFVSPPTQAEARRTLGLDPTLFTALVMRGGTGVGAQRTVAFVRAALAASLPLQLLVVTGRNQASRKRLEALVREATTSRTRVHVYGYVENMAELLTAADVSVGKPGGLTLAEAFAIGRPLFIDEGLPGTEDGNRQFITAQNVGETIVKPAALVRRLTELAEHPGELAAWQARAKAFGRPDAAAVVAHDILKG